MQKAISQSTIIDTQPIQLHVMHSWGGGLERWVQDYCRTDKKRINIVLKSIGIPGIPGQRIALYRHIDDPEPVRFWDLKFSIYSTSITSIEYCEILEEIIIDFQVNAILVSSLIGHTLDVLNVGIKTIIICHDYYPFCPAINIYFDQICIECQEKDLQSCFKENKYNRFFPNVSASSWPPIRTIFLELIRRNKIVLVTPSESVKNNLVKLENQFQSLDFFTITHGVDSSKLLPIEVNHVYREEKKLKILILGSLAMHKGLELFQEIYQDILKSADIFLLGCGEEGLLFSGISGIKIVAKSYSLSELPTKVKEISPDLSLLLSVWPETFSYTLSELMLLAIPTIATKIGSFEERIEEGKNGFLVEPYKDNILEKTRNLYHQRGLLEQVANYLKSYSHKSLQEMVDSYHNLVTIETPTQIKLSKELNFMIMYQSELERVQHQLSQIEELQQRIIAMESSKFWKIRKLWFKLKRMIGIPVNE